MTTTVLITKINEVEKKISDSYSLVTTTVLNTKMSEVENHAKYVTTPEFNKLTAEDCEARLKQADLMSTINFDKKL